MSGFLGRRKQSSGQIAKERLKLVLVHDRSGLSPIQQLEALKDDLVEGSGALRGF